MKTEAFGCPCVGQTGMTILELMIALGSGVPFVLGILAVVNLLARNQSELNVKEALHSRMIELRYFMRDRLNCTLNLQNIQVNPASPTAVPVPQLTYVQGSNSGQMYLKSGMPLPENPLLALNPGNGASPGISLKPRGQISTDPSTLTSNHSVELVLTATVARQDPAAAAQPVTLTDGFPLFVVLNQSGQILECSADDAAMASVNTRSNLCNATAPGTSFDPVTGTCKAPPPPPVNCYPGGDSVTASCQAGTTLAYCSFQNTDPNASAVLGANSVTRQLRNGNLPPATPPVAVNYPVGPGVCGCGWATGVNPGVCLACCSPPAPGGP